MIGLISGFAETPGISSTNATCAVMLSVSAMAQ